MVFRGQTISAVHEWVNGDCAAKTLGRTGSAEVMQRGPLPSGGGKATRILGMPCRRSTGLNPVLRSDDAMFNQFTHGHALLIGVGRCAYSADDAHIRLLHDAGATRQAILDGLAWLAQRYGRSALRSCKARATGPATQWCAFRT